MELNKIKQRLELALSPVEPPTLEEVLEHVSRRGVLRGPADWVFPAWMLYIEYVVEKIIEMFPLSEEEKRELLDFRDTIKRLLLEAQKQAKEKLTALYKAVAEGNYKLKNGKLFTPDGTWAYVIRNSTLHIPIHNVTAKTCFPDVLKLLHERLKLFQLGWRASDEGNDKGRPAMGTAQPWQLISWVSVRFGKLYIYVSSVNLTREGISVLIRGVAKSWRQELNKNEAIDLVASHFKRGEWAPLLTMWLGDGQADRNRVLRSDYEIVIITKEPWRLSNRIGKRKALVATGKEAFTKLKEAAGIYGVLLHLSKSHKWMEIKLATDDVLRITHKLKSKKRSIDVLREAYRRNNGEITIEQFSQTKKPKNNAIVVAGVVMHIALLTTRKGTLIAKYSTHNIRKALAAAERLESAGLKPNVVKSGPKYTVYIATADLLRLAEQDENIKKAIALYLTEKVKNGTPMQRETAEKFLKRHPLFLLITSSSSRSRNR